VPARIRHLEDLAMLADRRVHTTLPTQDVDGLRRFYEEVLGFAPLAIRPGVAAYAAGDGSLFVISRSGGKATGAHTQMAFTVPDVAAEVRDLQARGVVFESYELPKTENSVAQMPAGRGAWFKDPDGNLLGLFEFADPI
jgi:catechol 2,3-dioxygenase-like lactoylglutathione lyase family enzyme